MHIVIALIAGLLFGAGLAFSGMTDTAKVLGFLDLAGDWDPTLLFVMCAALAITMPAFFFITRRSKPICAASYQLPATKQIDRKLLIGAGLFGVGWGLYGWCPGPAIASMGYQNSSVLFFIGAMLAGMYINHRWFTTKR